MRQGQNPKRSRGRSSGRRNNVPTRHQTFDSNGPSVRIRGSANQVHEKYLAMAADAASAGDRIAAENFQQHAEHYFRIINADGEGRANIQRAERAVQDGQFTGDGDGDTDIDTADDAVVEVITPPPGNAAATPDVGEGSEQPIVEFPNGEDASSEAAAPAPKKPRAPRTPRGPRTPRARTPRAPSGGDEVTPSQPKE
ncbi:MAG: DUF4167 domain-containing protein [Alphaproteobacteria bacterium]|nr:DUF4167 domain-containing protein [Alphaproteobacteria bacterium]